MTWLTISRGLKHNLQRISIALVFGGMFLHSAQAQTQLAEMATEKIARSVKATGVRATAYDFYSRPPYRAEVPKPDTLLGYPLGTWHSTFRDQEHVLLTIAESAKDRVRYWEFGKSVEGRPLRLLAISSPKNIARLEEIRTANLRLADGRKSSATEVASLTKSLPAIVWISECIHGGETASFETAMATVYTLAASESPDVVAMLDNAVILVNPVFNPDGHERFVVSFNATATGSADSWAFENMVPWIAQGRFNHNRFDMNRDKTAQSQPETRQETREFLRWLPHVFVDQHGQPEVYFFPPTAQASNANIDRIRMGAWTEIFGRANAKVFDANGWAFVNRETYDFFYPGYLDSFTTLCGAVGMTYETDGGGNLVTRKEDGTLTTLRDATAHHFETAMATIKTAAEKHETLIHDFAQYKQSALKETGVVVVSPTRDPKRTEELASLLLRLGIEVKALTAPVKVPAAVAYESTTSKPVAQTFPAGSLWVDFSQPQGHLIRAILEKDAVMEPEFVAAQNAKRKVNDKRNENESNEEYDFYDTTAWSVPLIFGLEGFRLEAIPLTVPTRALSLGTDGLTVSDAIVGKINGNTTSAASFVLPFTSDNAAILATRLLQDGYRVSVATKAVTVQAKPLNAGTFIIRPSRNPGDLTEKLGSLCQSLGVSAEAFDSTFGGSGVNDAGAGSQNVVPISAPRIAVAAGDGVSQTSYGGVTYLLNQIGIAFTSVPIRALKESETRAAFNVVILPEGNYKPTLGKDDISALKDWMSDGGCLIGLGSGATWLTNKDADITSVRPVGESEDDKDKAKDKTKDTPETPINLPGAIFQATIRTDHFLGWGYPNGSLPVPLAGDTFWKLSDTGANVVTFPEKGSSHLSGFIWEGNTEKLLANTAYIVDEPIGSGHALLFLQDPAERSLYIGLRRILLSAILFGPHTP